MKTKISTIVRCVILIAAIINQTVAAVLAVFPDADSPVYQIISVAVTAVSAFAAAWKNNDFTLLAKISGAFFKALKDGKITADEAEALVAEISKSGAGDKDGQDNEEDKTE